MTSIGDEVGLDLSSLSIFPATPAQITESRKRTWISWGKGLTQEQYLERDSFLDYYEASLDGKLITWVLAPRNEPDTLNFKCSCETFRRVGLVHRRPEKNVPDPSTDLLTKPQEVICYGIASVFTLPSLRRRGYARHMLGLLHWVLAPRSSLPDVFPDIWGHPPLPVEGTANAAFSALYSDIGPNFYETCTPGLTDEDGKGWVVQNPISTTWEVSFSKRENEADRGNWEWLDKSGVDELWRIDAAQMKGNIDAASLDTPGSTAIAYLPSQGVAAYLYDRVSYFLPGRTPPVTHWGIISTADRSGPEKIPADVGTFATWSVEVQSLPRVLVVTRLRTNRETFPWLIMKLLEAARNFEMQRVEIWNLPKEFQDLASASGGLTMSRDEHLPALKWYGMGNAENVVWLYNERFCWC